MEEAASDSVRQCPAIQIRIARNASSDGSQPADPDPWCEKTRRTLNGPILVTDRLRGLCPDRRAGEHDRSHYQQKRGDHHECIRPPQRKSNDPHRSLLSPNTRGERACWSEALRKLTPRGRHLALQSRRAMQELEISLSD